MMDLEKEFNITIPEEVSEKIATVGQAIEYIEAKRQVILACAKKERSPRTTALQIECANVYRLHVLPTY